MQTIKRMPAELDNKAAAECTNHKMDMVSHELRYATPGEYGEPTSEVYTFRCRGSCGQTTTLTIDNN
jgi:hypothetical protein